MTALRTPTSPKLVVAILTATITIAAFTPAAFAAGPDRGARDGQRGDVQFHRNAGPMGGGGGQFLALGCGPNAAERIETSLVSLGYRVDATAEQKALLDTLTTAALEAQSALAATCEATLPAPVAAAAEGAETPAVAAERPDLLERLQTRLTIEQARVTAMADVLPQFEAFFNSLTDAQKQTLEPRERGERGHNRGERGDRGPGRDGGQHGDRGNRAPDHNRNG